MELIFWGDPVAVDITEEEVGEKNYAKREQQKRGAGKIHFREKVKIQENCICGFFSHAFLQGRG